MCFKYLRIFGMFGAVALQDELDKLNCSAREFMAVVVSLIHVMFKYLQIFGLFRAVAL